MTDYGQDEKMVNEIIKELVEECATSENFSVSDVAMVIQLTDTDDVFAKNAIQQDLTLNNEISTMYFEDKILTRNVLKLEETHKYKRERLIDCLKLTKIDISMQHKIPYEIYYMSSIWNALFMVSTTPQMKRKLIYQKISPLNTLKNK